MARRLGILAGGLVLVTAAYLHAQASAPTSVSVQGQAETPPADVRPISSRQLSNEQALLNKYCTTCHNDRQKAGGLTLAAANVDQVAEHPELWEKVVHKLRAGAMPPAKMPRPDKTATAAFLTTLETSLDRLAGAKPNPGRPTIHRLNRTEYTNAIRDLLDLELDGTTLLPPDDADLGFDNMADILSFSPVLLERSMSASRKISRMAIGTDVAPAVDTYSIPKMQFQDLRMSEDLPFGSRGGIAIRHYFPLDGEYDVAIRLRRQLYDYIRGLGDAQQLEVRLDGHLVKTFTVGGENKGKATPVSWAGFIFGDPEWEEYWLHADKGLTVRFPAKAGMRIVGVSFVATPFELEGVLQPRSTGKHLFVDETWSSPSGKPEAAIEAVDVAGPYNAKGPGETPSRQKIFVCRPASTGEEESCARRILSTLARRAFRRPPTPADVNELMGFFTTGRREGSFDRGIQLALERILLDPEFLVRIERDPSNARPDAPYRLSNLELASRISFFLWSSIPDDELLDVASRGKLTEPAVLEQQVTRMLRDKRAKALVNSFAAQWLSLRRLRTIGPIPELFPEFDENLREAFQRETELFLESQLREDRSLLDLLRADYSYVNEPLARHYGIPNVYGNHFRKVQFADDTRGGLLGQASILTVTSYPNRTSPVLRGNWVLGELLGAPPPPPPPNVPSLPDTGANGKPASVRERLEEHRKNPICANCHSRMDPLGFALENFDPIGKWRSKNEAGTVVDASGVSPDGTKFEGLAGLRKVLLANEEQFVGTVTEKLLTYALGRGVEHYDMSALRQIRREAAAADYRWSTIVLGIVKSTPFQMRRPES